MFVLNPSALVFCRAGAPLTLERFLCVLGKSGLKGTAEPQSGIRHIKCQRWIKQQFDAEIWRERRRGIICINCHKFNANNVFRDSLLAEEGKLCCRKKNLTFLFIWTRKIILFPKCCYKLFCLSILLSKLTVSLLPKDRANRGRTTE